MVLVALGSCGCMGEAAARLIGQLGVEAAASRDMLNGVFVQWEMRLLSVSLKRAALLICTAEARACALV